MYADMYVYDYVMLMIIFALCLHFFFYDVCTFSGMFCLCGGASFVFTILPFTKCDVGRASIWENLAVPGVF